MQAFHLISTSDVVPHTTTIRNRKRAQSHKAERTYLVIMLFFSLAGCIISLRLVYIISLFYLFIYFYRNADEILTNKLINLCDNRAIDREHYSSKFPLLRLFLAFVYSFIFFVSVFVVVVAC